MHGTRCYGLVEEARVSVTGCGAGDSSFQGLGVRTRLLRFPQDGRKREMGRGPQALVFLMQLLAFGAIWGTMIALALSGRI